MGRDQLMDRFRPPISGGIKPDRRRRLEQRHRHLPKPLYALGGREQRMVAAHRVEDQALRLLRRFMRLRTRSGFRLSNATRDNTAAVLMRPSPPLGIMRNSTFAMLCCLRPEMSIRVNQDTIHCATLGAQKSTQAQLSAPRRNIGHLIHRGGAFLAVSWSHHKSQRLDRPSGFLAWEP